MNINIFDNIVSAIEEYNNWIVKKDVNKYSDDELRGLFYTCLRRYVRFGNGRTAELRVEHFKCMFNRRTGVLESYSIPHPPSPHYQWSWEFDKAQSTLARDVAEIGRITPKFYPTKVLNNMALIVNSINQ